MTRAKQNQRRDQILKMLRSGKAVSLIARNLDVSASLVRSVAKSNKLRSVVYTRADGSRDSFYFSGKSETPAHIKKRMDGK